MNERPGAGMTGWVLTGRFLPLSGPLERSWTQDSPRPVLVPMNCGSEYKRTG